MFAVKLSVFLAGALCRSQRGRNCVAQTLLSVPISFFRESSTGRSACATPAGSHAGTLAAVKPSGGGGILAVERSVSRVCLRTLK